VVDPAMATVAAPHRGSEGRTGNQRSTQPFVARTIRRLSVPIILAWLAVGVIATVGVPSLEQVEKQHSVSLIPTDAPAFRAMERMNVDFKESDSFSVVMVVLEGQQPLGEEAHRYYDRLIRQWEDDPKHVRHIQNFWGDPVMAASVQSADGKAAYVQLNLAGNPGQTLGNESTESVRRILARTPPPAGITAYVTGTAAFMADMQSSGNKTILTITAVSLAVIFAMLLLVYRSVITVVLLLLTVGIELLAARGIVAFLGDRHLVGLTTYVVNLLVSIGIAAGTDYGIFFIGRYQEARQASQDREAAYYTAYRGVTKVVLASGLTIAGAIFCLGLTRLPYFQPLGVPCSVGILVAVAVALTLVPAVIAAAGRFGIFDPKRKISNRRWRRIATMIVRWPAPILIASLAIALIGLLALPGYKASYDEQRYAPKTIAASQGYAAAGRHFPQSRMMMPGILLIEADHDLRNPADFLVLNAGQGRTRRTRNFQSASRNQARGCPDETYVHTVPAQRAKHCSSTNSAVSAIRRPRTCAPWWAKIGRWSLLPAVLMVETGGVRRGDPDCLCGAVEPVVQHGGGGLPREPWIGAFEPERQTF